MPARFRILFLDDEETFLLSTTELLRREGFACDFADNVDQARRLVQNNSYQLVIADVNMAGNANLEFVSQLAQLPRAVSVILVTGNPSLQSAVQSIELPVLAYLVKPFELEVLVSKVRAASRTMYIRRMVQRELAHLRRYRRGLVHIEEGLQQRPPATESLEALAASMVRNILGRMASLQDLVAKNEPENCQEPRMSSRDLRDLLRDAVATLEHTKRAFKSKELGELRRRLQEAIEI